MHGRILFVPTLANNYCYSAHAHCCTCVRDAELREMYFLLSYSCQLFEYLSQNKPYESHSQQPTCFGKLNVLWTDTISCS